MHAMVMYDHGVFLSVKILMSVPVAMEAVRRPVPTERGSSPVAVQLATPLLLTAGDVMV